MTPFAVLAAATLQLPAPTEMLALSVSDGTAYVLVNSDVRTLPDGGRATFRERKQISFAIENDLLVATVRSLGRECDGPAAICAAFARFGAGSGAQPLRFRVGPRADELTLLEGPPSPVPAGAAGPETTAVIAAANAAAPGTMFAADLRQLLGFVGRIAPVAGATAQLPVGQVRVRAVDGDMLVVAIDRPTSSAGDVVLSGDGECHVTRATGLVAQCRYTDWLGDDRARPIRIRSVELVRADNPVS